MDVTIEVMLPARGQSNFDAPGNNGFPTLSVVVVYDGLKITDVIGMPRTGYTHVTGLPDASFPQIKSLLEREGTSAKRKWGLVADRMSEGARKELLVDRQVTFDWSTFRGLLKNFEEQRDLADEDIARTIPESRPIFAIGARRARRVKSPAVAQGSTNARLASDLDVFIRRREITRRDRVEVGHAFKELIIELERKHAKPDFPVTLLYRNWLNHATVTRSEAGLEVLEGINAFLRYHWSGSTDDLIQDISASLSLSALRAEVELALYELGVPATGLHDLAQWQRICWLVLSSIADRPISYDLKQGSHISRLRAQRSISGGLIVGALSISEDENDRAKYRQKPDFLWVISTLVQATLAVGPTIRGPIVFQSSL